MTTRMDELWKDPAVARRFLAGRGRAIPFAKDMGEVMLRLLAASDRPIRRFADVGCGGGRIGRLVLDAYPDAHGVFTDFSEEMLSACRETLDDCESRVTICSADFSAPDWRATLAKQGPYDAIVSGFAIHHLPHDRKRSIYADIYNLLAPGGLFVHLEHVRSAGAWGEAVHDRAFVEHAFQHGVWEEMTLEQAIEDYHNRPDRLANILAPIGQQLDWLRAIGFSDVDCFFKYFELSLFGGRKPEA